MGLTEAAGREVVDMPARGRGGGSFFGQAAKRTGIINTIANKPTRSVVPFPLLMITSSVRFVRALES
jgi:hypothetical protein